MELLATIVFIALAMWGSWALLERQRQRRQAWRDAQEPDTPPLVEEEEEEWH